MSTPARVGLYAVALVAVLGIGLGAGRLVGPLDTDPEPAAHDAAGHGSDGHDDHGESSGAEPVAGLELSRDGFTLALADPQPAPGRVDLRFAVTGPDGEPVTDYDEQHEKDLHLIVVRRDLTGFQHVHPELSADGEWSVPVDLTPGAWRVFADFKPAGADPLVLGADLAVGGRGELAPLGDDVLADSVDGYDVTLGAALAAGRPTPVTLTVSKDGEPVDDLEPYLGAHGHLVVLRAGDLGYLHAHPTGEGEEGEAGPAVRFETTFPSDGRYRLFLDFQHEGVVRTAEFTVTVGGDSGHDHSTHDHGEEPEAPAGAPTDAPSTSPTEHDDGHGHDH